MYSVNELSTLIPDPNQPGNFLGWNWPNAINEKGMIVGESETPQGNTRAVLWQGQNIQDLGTLDPDPNNPAQFLGDSSAYDINDSGTIVGISFHDNIAATRAFVWRGKMTELKPAAGFGNAVANRVNNQGSVAGKCEDSRSTSFACMWDPSGAIKVLGIPPPHAGFVGKWSSAAGINDKDEVIVWAGDYTWGTPIAPYLWRAGSWFPLFNSPAELDRPTAINNRSEVVGSGFRWDPNTGRHNLNASARAISELDLIVGVVLDRINSFTAVLVGFNGGTIDLNTLIPANPNWYLHWALGVNSEGWIVGSGKRDGRLSRGFVLLPEPQFGVDINTVAVVTKVLGGVAAGGGGIGFQLGNPIPFPIPPWGPEFRLPPDFERLPVTAQDVAAASGLLAVAQTIRDPDVRARITEIAGQLAGDRIKLLDEKG